MSLRKTKSLAKLSKLTITLVNPFPISDLFAEYDFGIRIEGLVDYLNNHHNIDCEAIAYNQILFESERDISAASLIISGYKDVKIV